MGTDAIQSAKESVLPVEFLPGKAPFCPELLAPAGNWQCARAAVENGADAIYFGLDRFNARMRADNFRMSDLPELMAFLHERGVRGYVTFNTLVFEDELLEAEKYLRSIISSGVDAVIVQDLGLCRMIRSLSPDFPIHGSTQMTVTSAAGVGFARWLGCDLVVLARECSLKEIGGIQEQLAGDPELKGFPLEVFVHGALCVAYSGQCLTSESLGGRSANRGECAQACRMPYELYSDGRQVPLGDRRYLLSPQDLAGIDALSDLVRTGVGSLKIEGRLKTPGYVANITRIYREAIDRVFAPGKRDGKEADGKGNGGIGERQRYRMEMAFSRGLSTGWLRGINNQKLVHGRFGKKRGVYLGEVVEVQNKAVCVRLAAPLKPGDGVVFDAGNPAEKEEGGRVYQVERRSGEIAHAWLHFGKGDLQLHRIHPGNLLWKTSDPELERELRKSIEPGKPGRRHPLRIIVEGKCGKALAIEAEDESGRCIKVESKMPLVAAQRHPLDETVLREQLGRLGSTPFELGCLEVRIDNAVILPVRELNRMRRQLVEDLLQARRSPRAWMLSGDDSPVWNRFHAGPRKEIQERKGEGADLLVQVRNLEQLSKVLELGIQRVYCDFESPKKYKNAVRLARSRDGTELFVAPPRIFKPGEEWILRQVQSSEPDGILVRNYDHVRFFQGCRLTGDFSLNVANHWSAELWLCEAGLERVTASYDLNHRQVEALLGGVSGDRMELTLHQRMPMFHMEHCVFCAFLSNGTDYTNCGRPCDKHRVELRDHVGAMHPLKADVGCRNTIYNSRAQTGAEHAHALIRQGARHFRIDFLDDTAAEVERIVTCYRQLLSGERSGAELWRELRLINQLGVTRGSMEGR